MSKESKPKPRDIADHVWRFHEKEILPDNEVMAAYLWEYALEIPEVLERVEESRRIDKDIEIRTVNLLTELGDPEPQKHEEWKLDQLGCARPERSECPTNAVIAFLANCSDFPSKHWLEVDVDARKRIGTGPLPVISRDQLKDLEAKGAFKSASAEVVSNQGHVAFQKPFSFPDRVMSHPIGKTVEPGGLSTHDRWVEVRLVTFSWARSKRKLREDFSKWLDDNEPNDRQGFHKSNKGYSGRSTERDKLKRLGAFRLLQYFGKDWTKARDRSTRDMTEGRWQATPKRPIYKLQTEWCKVEERFHLTRREYLKLVVG